MSPSAPGRPERGPGRVSRLRARIGQLASTRSEQEAEELRAAHLREGVLPIGEVRERQYAEVNGTVKTIALRPRATVPTLQAEISDGTGLLQLVWLGRREIPGIVPGARLTARGRVAISHGEMTLFNPAYDLMPRHVG